MDVPVYARILALMACHVMSRHVVWLRYHVTKTNINIAVDLSHIVLVRSASMSPKTKHFLLIESRQLNPPDMV